MNTTDRLRRRAASTVMTAGAITIICAIASASLEGHALAGSALKASAGSHVPADTASGTAGFRATLPASAVTLNLGLTPMPQGHLTISTSTGRVSLAMDGFTPGSSHEVTVSLLGMEVPLGTLTAKATGTASWSGSLSALYRTLEGYGISPPAAGGRMPGFQVQILDAGAGSPVIAQTSPITGSGTYAVHAVEPGRGVLAPGTGNITYNPAARTLAVTVDASGLTPGAHAAHIHLGSCQQQGAVVYSLTDFTADSQGAIAHQTRMVTGVNSVEFTGGWYFNLHEGNSSNITTSNGQPTINFRPVLCSNI